MNFKVNQRYVNTEGHCFIITKVTDTEIDVELIQKSMRTVVDIGVFNQWLTTAKWELDFNREFERELGEL